MLPDQFGDYYTEASQVYEKFTIAFNQNNYFIPLLNMSKAQRSMRYHLFGTISSTYLERFKANFKNSLKQYMISRKYNQEP